MVPRRPTAVPVPLSGWIVLAVLLLFVTPAAATEEPVPLFVQQRLEQLHFGEERKIGGETIYAAGLRVNELTQLLVADVELDERRLFIRQAKGAKDRYTLIDKGTAELLRPLVAGQPQDAVVFPVLDSRIRQFIIRAAKATGLKEKFDNLQQTLSPHTFRHAHATHLVSCRQFSLDALELSLVGKIPRQPGLRIVCHCT